MSDVAIADGRFGRRLASMQLLGAIAAIFFSRDMAIAQPTVEAAAPALVAKSTSPAATFAARRPGEHGFKTLPELADLYSGDLLVTLPGASLQGLNGAIALKSFADYDGKSPLPALETAFVLAAPNEVDLDIAISRGRIDLTNARTNGAAVVRLRFWDQSWKITLDAPSTRVAVEIYGRWPPGSRFKPAGPVDDGPRPAPVATLVLLVLKGSAAVDVGGLTLAIKSPPGPAMIEWDSVSGVKPNPQKLERLPEWANSGIDSSEDGKKAAAAVERFRKARADNPSAAMTAFLDSADPYEQRIALVALGATDDMDALGRNLSGAKTAEAWDFGIRVVRHWLGRTAGQEQKLYDALISPAHGYSPAHARIILRLLFGFSQEDLARPETYEVLIDYLLHDRRAIRNLAAWHLIRLLPDGQATGFSPSASKADCEKLYDAWKKLVPSGHVPPSAAKKR